MTDEERRQIIDAVITQLKNGSVNVAEAIELQTKEVVGSFVGYDKEGNIARVSPNVIEGGAVYLTETEYNYLVENDKIDENVEYNIYEDE